MKKSYVYKIMCLVTGEFYFGSSFNAKSDRYWGSGRRIKEQIAQYGKENFIKEILGEFDDRTIAHKVENDYIEKFINDEKCLNISCDHKFGTFSEETCAKRGVANAISLRGKTFSKEHKERISVANRGKILSKERKERISAAHRGKTLSEEHKARISAALHGKPLSEGHKANISDALRGKPHPHGKHWRKNPITGKREYYD